jgi:hypothetical protein
MLTDVSEGNIASIFTVKIAAATNQHAAGA